MKYVNHINLVLAVVGLAVVLYALSQTFFSPPRQATLDIQELQQRGSQQESQRRATEAATILRGATTTHAGGATEAIVARPARQPGVTGIPRVEQTRDSAGASTRPGIQTSRPTESSPVRIGRQPDGSVPAAPPPAAPLPRAGGFGSDDDWETRPQRPRTGALTVPPPGVEAEKRDAGSDPPAPPVRSSMPARRPQ